MNNNNIHFTIGICSFKRPQYLSQSINSVLSNTYQNFNIIISDDCSPNLEEIKSALEPFENHEKIQIFYQEKNLSWSNNRNFIKNQAKGDYLIIIGDDDLLLPNTLSTLSNEIKNNPNKDLYLFGFELIDENDRKINSFYSPHHYNFNYKNYDIIKRILKADHFPFWFFHPLTLCMNVKNMKDIAFNKEAGIGDDYLFLYDSIFHKKNFSIIPKKLFKWRKIQQESKESFTNISSLSMNNIVSRNNILKIMRQYSIKDENIFEYIHSNNFENDFLLKSILTAGIPTDIIRNEFGDDLYHKFIRYKKFNFKLVKTIQRLFDYIIFTRIKGLKLFVIFALERTRYKFNF
tara:strand:+ start:19827 stop:20867 length:1041 start_codon:yes stop_codon:yes gene_type:complete